MLACHRSFNTLISKHLFPMNIVSISNSMAWCRISASSGPLFPNRWKLLWHEIDKVPTQCVKMRSMSFSYLHFGSRYKRLCASEWILDLRSTLEKDRDEYQLSLSSLNILHIFQNCFSTSLCHQMEVETVSSFSHCIIDGEYKVQCSPKRLLKHQLAHASMYQVGCCTITSDGDWITGLFPRGRILHCYELGRKPGFRIYQSFYSIWWWTDHVRKPQTCCQQLDYM
jgi:hypothetical protein